MRQNRTWILGAPDPEMKLIEQLLRSCGETIVYAADEDGRRVHPGNAYRCPVPEVPEGSTVYAVECIDKLPEGWVRIDHHRPGDPGYGRPPGEFLTASSIGQVIAELAKTGALRRAVQDEIAHWMADNRDLPVAEYNEMLRTQWFWSKQEDMPGPNPYPSDGTIARGVSWLYDGYAVAVQRNDFYFERRVALIPSPLIYAAAADHCPAAAYRDECPGVDPDALMRWRVETRATFQGRPTEDILADVERAREALREAPRINLGLDTGAEVRDMRDAYTVHTVLVEPFAEGATVDFSGVGDSTFITFGTRAEGIWDEGGHHTTVRRGVPELPEAAAREGVAYLATATDRDGREKVVLGGHTTPETVQEFMDTWALAQGLVDIYGNPTRGFAGGYLPYDEEGMG